MIVRFEGVTMGAWGYGIRQDDFVLDVIGAFEDELKAGRSVADATRTVQTRFGSAIDDPEGDPSFWIALADAQWTYGALDDAVLLRVKEDVRSGRSLLAWQEDEGALARRRAALEKFISRIETANARPRGRPKAMVRPPPFQAGECLRIRLATGEYAAALVLAADHSTPELGMNLVGLLQYIGPVTPGLDVFRVRQWRRLTDDRLDIAWYQPIGLRTAKRRLEVVGRVEIRETDPKDSSIYRGWGRIGEPPAPR